MSRMHHNMVPLEQYVNDKSEERRVTKDTGNDELNINECSTLPTYSSFKSAIFPQLRPKRPQGMTKVFSLSLLENNQYKLMIFVNV